MPFSPRYVLLDFETTGLDPNSHELIEVGAVKVEGFEEVARYQTLIRPTGSIPKVIQELTGITDAMVADAPTLAQVAPILAEFLEDLPIVAHNSKVEQGFLDRHVSPLVSGIAYTVHNSIEPLALLLADSPSHSMESMRKWAGVDGEDAHRALKDCTDLLKVLRRAQDFMLAERPWLGAVVDHLLARWWWAWFFAPGLERLETKPSLAELLQKPNYGDLRELKKQDAEREPPAEIAIPRDEVRRLLHGENTGGAFQFRPAQERMSETIRAALEKGERVAIEAPTGTGKSMAYLIPGILAERAIGSPLVVSTHSKALQDQLLEKDLPLARKIFGAEGEESPAAPGAEPGRAITAATVKGQENYLCLRKFYQELTFFPPERATGSGGEVAVGMSAAEAGERFTLAFLLALAKVSRVAEIDRVSPYLRSTFEGFDALLERVKSHHLTTKGPPCPFYSSCHFFNSARLAHASDVLIANHSLVFHWPDHLPTLRDVVFDEAHHLEDQLTDVYSLRLRELELADILERLNRKGRGGKKSDGSRIDRLTSGLELKPGPRGEKDLDAFREGIQEKMRELSTMIPNALSRKGGRDTGGYEDSLDLAKFERDPIWPVLLSLADRVQALYVHLQEAIQAVATGPLKTDPATDLLYLYESRLEDAWQALLAATATGDAAANSLRLLHYNPRESLWRISVQPVDVRKQGQEFFSGLRTVALTSATLSSGTNPTFVTDRVGIALSKPFVSLPSPYPLEKQAIAFLPRDVAQPGTPNHLEALIGFTEQTARILGGRTMLLMTANHRLKHAAETLRARLEKDGIEVFDSLTDRRAIEGFKNTERAVLIGSERYGEGVDIPGPQLSVVIVEKINEAMTRGPLAEARKAKTKFSLFDYDFPLRMMWLKQRVGRLIRSPTDRGAVVIFDPRYHAWGASSQNWVNSALAPIPVVGGTQDEILMRIEAMGL